MDAKHVPRERSEQSRVADWPPDDRTAAPVIGSEARRRLT
jgi:hypothetical protein